EVFVDDTIIISQDDKAKVSLGVLAVANSNDSLRLDQLAIFVKPKYFVGTMSLTHMFNFESIIPNQQFAATIMKEDKVKPVWVLLSAYNPIEHSMASLFKKFAGIMLPIDEFRSHLDSQRKVVNKDLVCKNLEFAGKSLYDI
ncbi:33152_t:CDS:2, partial [Gigaspora margarita]